MHPANLFSKFHEKLASRCFRMHPANPFSKFMKILHPVFLTIRPSDCKKENQAFKSPTVLKLKI
jgi:hypothetical protein